MVMEWQYQTQQVLFLNVSRFLQYLGPQCIGNYTIICVGIPLGLLYSVVDTQLITKQRVAGRPLVFL